MLSQGKERKWLGKGREGIKGEYTEGCYINEEQEEREYN
jgi:hypothetical protein